MAMASNLALFRKTKSIKNLIHFLAGVLEVHATMPDPPPRLRRSHPEASLAGALKTARSSFARYSVADTRAYSRAAPLRRDTEDGWSLGVAAVPYPDGEWLTHSRRGLLQIGRLGTQPRAIYTSRLRLLPWPPPPHPPPPPPPSSRPGSSDARRGSCGASASRARRQRQHSRRRAAPSSRPSPANRSVTALGWGTPPQRQRPRPQGPRSDSPSPTPSSRLRSVSVFACNRVGGGCLLLRIAVDSPASICRKKKKKATTGLGS
jgi:hypothetical protein